MIVIWGLARGGRGGCSERGYTLRRGGKSPERIDPKGVAGRPLCRRVCKRLRTKGLNQGDEFGLGAGKWWMGIGSVMGLGTSRLSVNKHEIE